MTKKYAVFTYDKYYPSGGWDDLIFLGTKEELLSALETMSFRDYRHVVDLEKGEKISFQDLYHND